MSHRKTIAENVADYIESETKGGYLQDWGEAAPLLSQEQQRDYFVGLGRHIVRIVSDNFNRKPK